MSKPDENTFTGLRAALHRPDPLLCAFATIPDPAVAAILGHSGFDLVVLDGEHGPFTAASARGCIDALVASPAQAMIRVAANDPTLIKQALDLGAEGVLVPMVSDADQAAAAVRAARYPPDGNRGIGTGHASRYGQDIEAYLGEANAKLGVLATIETAAGVENAAAIAAVAGLDGIVIGPTDLAGDLAQSGGGPEQVQEAIGRVAAATLAAGLKLGIGCDPEEITDLTAAGVSLFACYFDGLALGADAARAAAAARAASV